MTNAIRVKYTASMAIMNMAYRATGYKDLTLYKFAIDLFYQDKISVHVISCLVAKHLIWNREIRP